MTLQVIVQSDLFFARIATEGKKFYTIRKFIRTKNFDELFRELFRLMNINY